MRDYGRVAPSFWTGDTGRALRKSPEAQTVALYLLTGPHSTMLGIFQCPVAYIAHETGLPSEGASKGLLKLQELGFCSVDEEADLIWVHEMARFQIGDSLKPKDNRVLWLNREFRSLPKSPLISAFLERYGEAYCLTYEEPCASPSPRGFERGSARPSPSQSKAKQEQKKEDAAPPPDGGEALPPTHKLKSSPSIRSTSTGGSKPPGGSAATGAADGEADAGIADDAVKRAEAEVVLLDPQASDEDRFWALKFRLADKGVRWGMAMKLSKALRNEGYQPVVAALEKTLKARDPTTYLGKIVSELRREDGPSMPAKNGSKSKLPPEIQNWADDGYPVQGDGPNRWMIAGQIYDDGGEIIGW